MRGFLVSTLVRLVLTASAALAPVAAQAICADPPCVATCTSANCHPNYPCETAFCDVDDTCVRDFASQGHVCRASAGPCDVAETCNGNSVTCPADTKVVAGTVCSAASAAACTGSASCDGVSNACGASPPAPAGTVCRAAAGICDVAESCTGSATGCPADAKLSGVVCRAGAGICDVAETCNGAASDCPADAKVPAGTVCRSGSAVGCSAEATCDGSAPGCGANPPAPATTVCRASAGPCDLADTCTGTTLGCPADAKVPAGTACRAGSAADCTGDATCDGSAPGCGANPPAPRDTVCLPGSAADCTADARCTGSAGGCPARGPALAGTVCRLAAGACDEPEACSGVRTGCPADVLKAAQVVCEAARSTCEQDAVCSGSSPACQDHPVTPNGTACDAQSLCLSGGSACLGAVCLGGSRVVVFDSTEVKVEPGKDATVVVRHAPDGPAIDLTGLTLEPADAFRVIGAPTWPVLLEAGETVSLQVQLVAERVGSYTGTLTVRASGCRDADLQVPVGGAVGGQVERKPGGCGSPGGLPSLAALALALLGLRRRR